MADHSSNSDFRHVFGGQDWEEPPAQPQQLAHALRRRGKKRPAASTSSASADQEEEEGAGGQAMVFPVKLHHMLTQIDEQANSDKDSTTSLTCNDSSIVSWQPHGRCFLVHDKDAFVQRFLPRYFRQSKWASFQRQLNIYGFQRLTAGRDRGTYYHDLFLRGHPELCTRIHRMKLKGIGQGRHRTNAELEPNFYRMTPVGPGDRIDASTIGRQPNASAAAVAYAASGQSPAVSAPVAAAGAPTTSTINVLQLFGGSNTVGAQGPSNASSLIAGNQDLNNLFFLTNGNELTSLQNLGSVTMSANGANTSSESGRGTNQESLQSAQHLNMLATLFNQAANTNNIAGTVGTTPSHGRSSVEAQDNSNMNAEDLNQWSTSSLFASNSNIGSLLPNQDAELLTTATLMQYMSDSNSPDGTGSQSHSPPDATSGYVASKVSARSSSQSAWTSLQTAGFQHGDPSTASASRANNLTTSNSSNDLINTFLLDGPSLRRMSAAAMTTIINATGGNSSAGGSNSASNPFDSNPNLLLFSSLHQSRNSSNSLIESPSADPPGKMTATQALNRIAAQYPSSRDTSAISVVAAPGPSPTPASKQLVYLNATAAAGGSTMPAQGSNTGGGQSGYLFGDLLSARAATANSQPTFLDSVYEPIPIKENTPAISETTAAAPGGGQQHKLSPRAAGASTDPSQAARARSGFHYL